MDTSKLYGIIGSAVFCLLTFLILWFVFMPARLIPPEDEGIMVSFGDNMDGLGFGDMIAGTQELTSPTSPPQPAEQQELLTQEKDKTLLIPKKQATPKTTNSRQVTEQEIQRREQQRREALAAAESRKRQEAAARSENLVGNAFGNSGSGSGTTDGDTRQGNPAGSGTSGGHGWSLAGRSLVGSLATPAYPSNVEGRITVSIRVDANGRVTSTSIGSPTNISDSQTRNAALSAARNTRFSSGSGVSVGTITYNFRLK
ncbi:MAG: cell envelope integrity protein TolA [Paludibacteraceae bacterium]